MGKQTQDKLAQIDQEFQEEGMWPTRPFELPLILYNMHANQLKSATVYGDQHKQCLKGTRMKTLAAIHKWIEGPSNNHKIFYLLDVPGSGKSTVSKELCKALELKRHLVGRFFFLRDTEETKSIRPFCSAVCDAFANQSAHFKQSSAVFKQRPGFMNLSFEEQLEGLVIGPLRELNQPAVLIVDAVDECDNNHEGRDQLLNALHTQHSSVPLLRIFVTGRPEVDIKQRAQKSVGAHTFRELEGLNTDVEQYIHWRLYNELPNGRHLLEDQRLVIVRGANGLFIWARTACDMLVRSADPEGPLQELGKEVSLTGLYTIAMRQAMPRDGASQRAILSTLGMILAAKRPLSVEELRMLSPKPTVVESVVGCLGSFLVYDDHTRPIHLVHITFRDFITDGSKSGPYFVSVRLGHHVLASQSLAILGNATMQRDYRANKLKENIQREVI
jgi:hypothetical protein